jgi:hypothetical protein
MIPTLNDVCPRHCFCFLLSSFLKMGQDHLCRHERKPPQLLPPCTKADGRDHNKRTEQALKTSEVSGNVDQEDLDDDCFHRGAAARRAPQANISLMKTEQEALQTFGGIQTEQEALQTFGGIHPVSSLHIRLTHS